MPAPDGPVTVRVWPAADSSGTRLPVLLALHGWADSGEVFGPLSDALDRRWTVIAPDAPGHGGTSWPDRPEPLIPAQVRAAVAVLDALPRVDRHRSPVVALGHGLGALTAARLAAARPEVVVELVLEEPVRTAPRRTPSVPSMRAWAHRLRDTDHAGRLAYLRREHPDWPAPEHEPWARSKEQVDLTQLNARARWGPSLPVLLSEVGCPVTIVHGTPARGGLVSRPAVDRCAALCAGGATIVELAAGHSPRREDPAGFLGALTAALERAGR